MKVHLRLDGESRTLDAEPLRIHPRESDTRILERLARALDIPEHRMRGAIVDRSSDAIVVRPPAVFG